MNTNIKRSLEGVVVLEFSQFLASLIGQHTEKITKEFSL